MKKNNQLGCSCKRKWLKILLEMKILVFLILVLSYSTMAKSYSQNQKVSIEIEQATILDVLNEIKEQTGLRFLYKKGVFDNFERIDIEVENEEVKNLLDQLLREKGLECEVEEEVITFKKVVKNNSEPQAKERQIQGTVKDKAGVPLPGVSVIVKGSTMGVATDIDGNFSMSLQSDPKTVLVISFVGMKTQEVLLGNQTSFEIVLEEDSANLGEVVVTGLQTIEKGRATGSFTVLDNEEMDKIYSVDFREKLAGTTSGLYVDKDNNITIRGLGSFKANTTPLIVVDGIPMESDALNINPNDIEQVSVLKDAASASVWGVRAANGVIVISTKRGKKGKMEVSYSGNYTIEEKMNLSDNHYLPADQYAKMEWDHYANGGWRRYNPKAGYTEVGAVYLDFDNGDLTEEQAKAKVAQIGSFDNQKQLEKYFYQAATIQQHNISVRGGSEKTSQYLSLNYDHSKGMLIGNESDKINLVSNTDYKISDKLKVGLSLRGRYQKSENNGMSPTSLRPYQRIVDENGSYVFHANTSVDHNLVKDLENLGLKDWSHNLLRERRENDNTTKSFNVNAGINLQYEILEGLTISTQGNYEIGSSRIRNHYNVSHYKTRDATNRATEVEYAMDYTTFTEKASKILNHHYPVEGGMLDKNYSDMTSFVWRNKIEFQKNWEDVRIKIMAGNEMYEYHNEGFSNRILGYSEDALTFQNVDVKSLLAGKLNGFDGRKISPSGLRGSEFESLERYNSYFGTASVTYKDKYDLFASVRLDRTNLLVNADKYRNNPSWSIGGKWDISREDFFKSEVFDLLSLKASYGLSGNMAKDVGPDITGELRTSYWYPGLSMLTIRNPENKELGWEKTYTINAGLDFAALNNRLSGTVEFYNKKAKDVLTNISFDGTSGFNEVLFNAANILNRGIDVSLNARLINKSVKLDVGGNFSYNYNKVLDLNFTPDLFGIIFDDPIKNQSIGEIWAFRYAGLDNKGEPQVMRSGDDTVLPWSEIGNFELDDLVYMGSKNPPIFGSFTTGISYKDFRLDALITYKFGHKVRMPVPSTSAWSGQKQKWLGDKYQWVKPGDEATKNMPVKLGGSYEPQYRGYAYKYSDHLVDKGDIVRLKTISLSYQFNNLLKNTPIKNANIKFSAQNLWFWAANRYDLDSDYLIYSNGSSRYANPARKKFIVSLNLNF